MVRSGSPGRGRGPVGEQMAGRGSQKVPEGPRRPQKAPEGEGERAGAGGGFELFSRWAVTLPALRTRVRFPRPPGPPALTRSRRGRPPPAVVVGRSGAEGAQAAVGCRQALPAWPSACWVRPDPSAALRPGGATASAPLGELLAAPSPQPRWDPWRSEERPVPWGSPFVAPGVGVSGPAVPSGRGRPSCKCRPETPLRPLLPLPPRPHLRVLPGPPRVVSRPVPNPVLKCRFNRMQGQWRRQPLERGCVTHRSWEVDTRAMGEAPGWVGRQQTPGAMGPRAFPVIFVRWDLLMSG